MLSSHIHWGHNSNKNDVYMYQWMKGVDRKLYGIAHQCLMYSTKMWCYCFDNTMLNYSWLLWKPIEMYYRWCFFFYSFTLSPEQQQHHQQSRCRFLLTRSNYIIIYLFIVVGVYSPYVFSLFDVLVRVFFSLNTFHRLYMSAILTLASW